VIGTSRGSTFTAVTSIVWTGAALIFSFLQPTTRSAQTRAIPVAIAPSDRIEITFISNSCLRPLSDRILARRNDFLRQIPKWLWQSLGVSGLTSAHFGPHEHPARYRQKGQIVSERKHDAKSHCANFTNSCVAADSTEDQKQLQVLQIPGSLVCPTGFDHPLDWAEASPVVRVTQDRSANTGQVSRHYRSCRRTGRCRLFQAHRSLPDLQPSRTTARPSSELKQHH
jgi:hypothetical protein